jgi:hypothetical protein
MHKSIIIFLSLLTFLIPVAPSISNSNALAFDNYGYEQDQYEQYTNHMTNDNYYKSQGSDFVKKIKCNNNNININGENTGDINFGNEGKGAATEDGYLGASSIGGGNTD